MIKGNDFLKILVIFTGGTIGSTVSDGIISSDKTKKYKLIDMYRKSSSDDIEFTYDEPYTLLSEDLTGEYMNKLGRCIESHLGDEIDGMIVTHGTDTVQYHAAAIDLAFPKLNLPVLFVSGNYVLDDPASNGLANFTAAADFIKNKIDTGVFVPYRNSNHTIYIHRAVNLLPHLPYCDDMTSIASKYAGIMSTDGTFEPNENYSVCCSFPEGLLLPSSWSSGILRITPYPGMSYPKLAEDTCRAILLDTYHSGTLCSINPDMKDFCESAYKFGIPMYLTGAGEGPQYESVKTWKGMHVNTLKTGSPTTAYMKLWMALEGGAGGAALDRIMMN